MTTATNITPAIEQTTVHIYQPQEFHNPGGSLNTIWGQILSDHVDEVQAVFANEFMDTDAVRVKTEWYRNEEFSGGTAFRVFIEYAIKDIGAVDISELVQSAIDNLPDHLGMVLARVETHDTLSEGIWRNCEECRGVGEVTRTTNGGRFVEIDCKVCTGTGRVLTTEI